MTVQELVYTKGDRVVTDSITLAAAFEKRHDKVLRDIRGVKCTQGFRVSNFGESEYTNQQGRKMPMFVLTYEGFIMVAMGYSGEKAIQFKERFIKEFTKVRPNMESQQSLERPQEIQKMIASYEDQITIRSHQQREIQKAVKLHIHSLFPFVKDSGRRKYYSKLYQDMKVEFNVNSYRDIRLKNYEDAILFVQNWDSFRYGESSITEEKE